MESTLWHFGASGVSKVPRSEWPNKRDGQHILFDTFARVAVTIVYLNVGDIIRLNENDMYFVTTEGVDEAQVMLAGTP